MLPDDKVQQALQQLHVPGRGSGASGHRISGLNDFETAEADEAGRDAADDRGSLLLNVACVEHVAIHPLCPAENKCTDVADEIRNGAVPALGEEA